MQDTYLNEFLKKALDTYDFLIAHNKPVEASKVLRTSSLAAEMYMVVHGMKPEKVFCSKCRRQLKTAFEVEFNREVGSCSKCDHLQTDSMFI